jgi:hypothetical protein
MRAGHACLRLVAPISTPAQKVVLSSEPEHGFIKGLLSFIVLIAMLASAYPAFAAADQEAAYKEPLDATSIEELKTLFKTLIDAENDHNTEAVKPYVWDSPSTLFVAKTATAAEGNWAGFWGKDVVIAHFHDLYQGSFHMEPDYSKEKIVGLTPDVAEIYAPVAITVSYAGQTPVPKPFLIIMDWIKTPEGWRMASDIALPVPPPPATSN